MTTLDELGVKFRTDKSSIDHGYLDFYETLFAHRRHDPIQLLELGVYAGASLQMWDEYFTHPEGHIIGIDCGILDDLPALGPRVRAYRSDQTKIPLAMSLGGVAFDIIIDDASHLSSKTIGSFLTWWPLLKPGGTYIVEDVSTSYYFAPPEGSTDPDRRPRNQYGYTAMQWFKRLADHVNFWAYPPAGLLGDFAVASITFRPNLVIVEKAA